MTMNCMGARSAPYLSPGLCALHSGEGQTFPCVCRAIHLLIAFIINKLQPPYIKMMNPYPFAV